MSYGISVIKNANDKILIDQNYRNLRVMASGSATVATGAFTLYGTDGLGCVISTSGLTNPILFMQLGSIKTLGGYIDSNGDYRVKLFNTAAGPVAANDTIPYALCAMDTSGGTGGGVGLAVLDDQGRVVFSSSRSYMRLAHGATLDVNQTSFGGNTDVTTPNISLSAYMAIPGAQMTGVLNQVGRSVMTIQRTSTTVLNVADYVLDYGSGFSGTTAHVNPIVDLLLGTM